MASETCDFYAGADPPLAPDKNGQTLGFHRYLSTTLSSLLVGLGPTPVCQLVVDADYELSTQPVFVWCFVTLNSMSMLVVLSLAVIFPESLELNFWFFLRTVFDMGLD